MRAAGESWIPDHRSSPTSTGRGCAKTYWKVSGREGLIRGIDDQWGALVVALAVPRRKGKLVQDRTVRQAVPTVAAKMCSGHGAGRARLAPVEDRLSETPQKGSRRLSARSPEHPRGTQ